MWRGSTLHQNGSFLYDASTSQKPLFYEAAKDSSCEFLRTSTNICERLGLSLPKEFFAAFRHFKELTIRNRP